MHIGDRIKARRISLGWSQRDLAERMGYKNHSVVARVEAGKVDLPQSRLTQFSQVLGVSQGQLLGWEQKPEEMGALAAKVLKDPGLTQLVINYEALDEADRATVAALVESLAKKKKG